jgi:hypothetical protein
MGGAGTAAPTTRRPRTLQRNGCRVTDPRATGPELCMSSKTRVWTIECKTLYHDVQPSLCFINAPKTPLCLPFYMSFACPHMFGTPVRELVTSGGEKEHIHSK